MPKGVHCDLAADPAGSLSSSQITMSGLPPVAQAQRQPYPSDLSDAEWAVLAPLLPAPKGFGHPRTVDLREILNAIFYVQRSGCQWERLPHDLPPYPTVYGYFRNGNVKVSGRCSMPTIGDPSVAASAIKLPAALALSATISAWSSRYPLSWFESAVHGPPPIGTVPT